MVESWPRGSQIAVKKTNSIDEYQLSLYKHLPSSKKIFSLSHHNIGGMVLVSSIRINTAIIPQSKELNLKLTLCLHLLGWNFWYQTELFLYVKIASSQGCLSTIAKPLYENIPSKSQKWLSSVYQVRMNRFNFCSAIISSI